MKRTIFALLTMLVVFVAVSAVLVLRPVAKVKADHHGCSNATLKGNYGLVAPGFYYNGTAIVPANFSMLATFDGKGDLSGSSVNIVVAGTADPVFSFTGGTYTVNSDCTCTLDTGYLSTFGATVTGYGIAVDTGGDEVAGNMISSLGNVTATFDAKRVAEGQWGFSK